MANDNLILEHLRAIRGRQDDNGERLDRIEVRLSSMEQTLGSLYTLSGGDRDTARSLARRIERIERRLEISD
jgi:archaellum component FlaC